MIEPRPAENTPRIRSVVVSPEGAAIRLERIELSDDMRRRLTAEGVTYLPPPPGSKLKR
ncbi:hypothetical protein [Longimicrobium sp.]|uniref:hypothetical protein n=1 Tax=Longimicrobium sp. TaxID=2029185 RepID=UPI002CEDEA33|nr:hypothetical protein [Longimicrobium sp.]HSU15546.1 hypothetical protein [Longimicrobium sp.]